MLDHADLRPRAGMRQPASDCTTVDQTGQGVRAWQDIADGLGRWRIWTMLGWLDVRQRYNRSNIGPFWITISMAVMIAVLGVVYSVLFRLDPTDFLPFLAGGFVTWSFISNALVEGSSVFVAAEGLIKHGGIPLSIHIFRLLARNLIIFAHNFAVIPVVYLLFGLPLSPAVLLLVPGLILVTVNLAWILFILAPTATRFRDLPPVIGSVLQIVFYVTPILYKPELLTGGFRALERYNPASHLIDLVRAPLLGQAPGWESWVFLILTAIVGWLLAFRFYRRVRRRIAYWI